MKNKAKKKSIEVWATKYDETTDTQKLIDFMQGKTSERISLNQKTKTIFIHKERGTIALKLGNWLLYEKNTDQCFWVIDEEIFYKTYKKVDDGTTHIFSKKPIEISYFDFANLEKQTLYELFNFVGIKNTQVTDYLQEEELLLNIQENNQVRINTLEGVEALNVGEYLVQGINGEFYPVSSKSFNKVYEKI